MMNRGHTSMIDGKWRLMMILVAIPLAAMSCGTAPHPGGASSSPPLIQSAPISPQAYFHFLRGYLSELANKPIDALKEYQASLSLDQQSVFLKAKIAWLYFSMGSMGAAVKMADRIPVGHLNQPSVLFQLAKIYAGTGQTDRAMSLYDQAIVQDPTNPQSFIGKGALLVGLKRWEEAEQVFQALVVQVPRSALGHYFLGVIAAQVGNPVEAEGYFNDAITMKDRFKRPYRALAALYESQEEPEKAIEVYERFLKAVNSHDKAFRLQLVRIHLQMRAYQQALDQLARMIEDDPGDRQSQVRVALIYGEMGQYQQAIKELVAILEARPNDLRVRDYLGMMFEEMKDVDRARQAYQENLNLDPTFYDSLLHLGVLSYRLKQYDEAIPLLNQAAKLNPKRSESYLLLGLTYMQTEQYPLASSILEKGIQQDPENADLHFNLGTAYDKLDRFNDVVREMERTLQLSPDYADALNYLGYSYADRDMSPQKALELTKRAVELKPDNGYYVDSFGWAQFKVGQIEQALKTIQHAASLVGDDPVIFEHLGSIYVKRHDLDKAKEAWAQSIALDSSNQALIDRFRQQGFGEPLLHGTNPSSSPQVSHHSFDGLATP